MKLGACTNNLINIWNKQRDSIIYANICLLKRYIKLYSMLCALYSLNMNIHLLHTANLYLILYALYFAFREVQGQLMELNWMQTEFSSYRIVIWNHKFTKRFCVWRGTVYNLLKANYASFICPYILKSNWIHCQFCYSYISYNNVHFSEHYSTFLLL